MPQRSNEFQHLVYLIKRQYADRATVTESKMLPNRLTGTLREVDICIETTVAGHDLVISVECRDHSRANDVTWVEQMKAKHDLLPTNALVLVSRSGFSSEALRVASLFGIETLALEDVDKESINQLLGKTESLWAKVWSLSPIKVVVRVAEINGLAAENVATFPDNTVYLSDGVEVGSITEVVLRILNSEPLIRQLGESFDPAHKSFVVQWDVPKHVDGRPLCLQKIEPLVLRPIEYIRINGECHGEVTEFPLNRGAFGNIQIAWASGMFYGSNAMMVAAKDETGAQTFIISSDAFGIMLPKEYDQDK